jgi:hypothetical protein
MQVDGKCFCGAVTYAAEIDERQVLVCHCTDCQNHSGSAYRVAAAGWLTPTALAATIANAHS